MYYRPRFTTAERARMQADRFLEMWDAGKRAEAVTFMNTMSPEAKRLIDDEAQARSERACRV